MLRCCEKCFEYIAKKNIESATLWAELCDEYPTENYFSYECDYAEFFKTLEQESYIVTTECYNPEFLSSKLCGVEPYSNFCCVKMDVHY